MQTHCCRCLHLARLRHPIHDRVMPPRDGLTTKRGLSDAMQYQQTRTQSAEFLRVAVGHMGRQEAALDPASYTLWYEHVAGRNPPLSQILQQRLPTPHPLTDADVAHLYATYI